MIRSEAGHWPLKGAKNTTPSVGETYSHPPNTRQRGTETESRRTNQKTVRHSSDTPKKRTTKDRMGKRKETNKVMTEIDVAGAGAAQRKAADREKGCGEGGVRLRTARKQRDRLRTKYNKNQKSTREADQKRNAIRMTGWINNKYTQTNDDDGHHHLLSRRHAEEHPPHPLETRQRDRNRDRPRRIKTEK